MTKIENRDKLTTPKNAPPSQSENDNIEKKIETLQHELYNIEKKCLGLFELTNDAIFLIDITGTYKEVNQRAAEMLGYNKQDMIGKSYLDFIIDEEKESAKEKLSDLVAGKILPLYERKFKRSDGKIFQAEVNASIVQDENGQPEYIQSVIRDISGRIKAQETLLKERRAFHLIAEATIYAVDISDLCQRIILGITQILGFDASFFGIFEKETRMLIPIAQINFKDIQGSFTINPIHIDDPNYIFSYVAKTKRAVIWPRYEDKAIFSPILKSMEKEGICAMMTWPILDSNEDLLGILQLLSYKVKEIPEEDMLFFETIARMFTVAFERKKAEDALVNSEEKYRSFAQNFKGIAYRKGINEKPIFYNGAVSEITGYSEEEFMYQNPDWGDIIHKEDSFRIKEIIKMLQNYLTKSIEVEYRIIRKDKQIRWVHDIIQIVNDEQGTPTFIQGAIYDISDRKRNENLIEIQHQLSLALSSTSNIQHALDTVLDASCKIDFMNCGCIHLVDNQTGFLNSISNKGLSKDFIEKIAFFSSESPFTRAILTGKPVYSDYNDLITALDDWLVKKENLHSLANIPIHSDDKIVAILSIGSKNSDAIPINTRNALEIIANQISGAIGRIRAEEAFRESDKRYRLFVENFQGIAYRTDVDMKPVFYHGAVEEITGYTSNELVSKKNGWSNIVHPYDLDVLKKAVEELRKNKSGSGRLEYRIINKDGQILWVQDIWQSLHSPNSIFLGVQGSIYNINERKIAQNELQKLYQDLEKRVQERTEQLSATNKELTAFSYSVSHDLRTPIRHIGGFTQLLQKRISSLENPDERVLSYTQKILDSIEEMNKLIDGLLTFSRMSRVELVKIQINLTNLVQEVLNDFQIEFGNRKIDIKFNILPDVQGDPALLRLVLVNIISNALKFTKKREVAEIEINSQPSNDPENVIIYVRDNGVGFDMKYYDKLFGVFQRLHKTEEFEGTGIGLATVQRVIHRMGGKIWAEGEIDKGATFYFSIPKAINFKH